MTGGNQVFDDGRANETGGSGNKHTHEESLQVGNEDHFGFVIYPSKVVML
jgi:hypothetical protein